LNLADKEGKRMVAEAGTLYLCATPIGNLGDMTFRAVETLRTVALIAAEDTRHSRKLTSHFDIHVPLTSYHEHNKRTKGPELLEKLLSGQDVALISDAGLPGISDPGEALVQLAIEAGIRVIPIPGANAALTALIASGLPTDGFVFIGFLPKLSTARKTRLRTVRDNPLTLLFYESPHQLLKTLLDIQTVLGDRQAVVGRELTKLHEDFQRGPISRLRQWFLQNKPRGEFTLVVAGCTDQTVGDEALPIEITDQMIIQEVARSIAAGANKKDAVKTTASKLGLQKRRVYQLTLESDG
jgi:16S rRNA (cytidine1402-2'-O)-methyltransferase